jgi:CheY-like chemotaxis protein
MGGLILVVDDNPINARLVLYLLTAVGYDVASAGNSDEVLVFLEARLPDLILMDVQLPGMDGLSLTRQLKADPRTRDIPVIALTACAMAGDEARARSAGCDGYLTKPIDTRALPEQIAAHLRAAPAQRSRAS